MARNTAMAMKRTQAPSSASDDTMDFDVPGDGARGPQYGYDDEPYEAPYSAADDTMGFEPPDGGTGGYGGGDGGYSGQPPRGGRHGKDGFFRKYLSGHGLAVALSAAGVVLVGVLGVVAAVKFGLLGTGGLPASSPAPSGSTGISGAVPGSSSSVAATATPESSSQSSSTTATATPRPSATPRATATPRKTAAPTATPQRTATPQPTATPQKTSTPPAHTHSWVKQSETAATCTAGGTITYKCSCGETKTENTAALGHNWQQTPGTQTPPVKQAAPLLINARAATRQSRIPPMRRGTIM